MATEHEVYRSAWRLLKAHGSQARREALRRAREFEQSGALNEAAAWARLASTVAEIAKSIPSMTMQ